MPILDGVSDTGKIHSFDYQGTTIQVRRNSMSKLGQYMAINLPPDAGKDQRRVAVADFLAYEILEGWDDPDIPFDRDVIADMLKEEDFAPLKDAIDMEASKDENFLMTRAQAVKKHSAFISKPKKSGAKIG